MREPVRVGVVALDRVLEAGTRSALEQGADLLVVDSADRPAVVVVVVDRVTEPVLDLVRRHRADEHRPEVVLVATELAPTSALHAIACGARGLLRRQEASVPRLAATVLAAAQGDCSVPPDLLDGLLERGAAGGMSDAWGSAGLSEREQAVLRMVADGRETSEIARELCYSVRTVTTVLHDVTQRFRLRNRAHAVAYALRAGLL
ncbi:helix-turn-helix transcriptional regulator [Streptomyces bohaiensis]|uniref:Response regulator transcription factor n=1 Tax=Streptomyces bohaiensis TaxID=1431344 RepID=A0ABX1C705_9ACTN|nr:LuxR C-terminal-related transcriptional regulator [Streptomyces bohaiensis]NJQ14946.1 response regulator transcription factor [Streptomyces bohaiensis]